MEILLAETIDGAVTTSCQCCQVCNNLKQEKRFFKYIFIYIILEIIFILQCVMKLLTKTYFFFADLTQLQQINLNNKHNFSIASQPAKN